MRIVFILINFELVMTKSGPGVFTWPKNICIYIYIYIYIYIKVK
jgi:hypothetical protein